MRVSNPARVFDDDDSNDGPSLQLVDIQRRRPLYGAGRRAICAEENALILAPAAEHLLPPPLKLPGGHRPYLRHTHVGALMEHHALRAWTLSTATSIQPRRLTEYLARRARPSRRALAQISFYFSVHPMDLIDDEGFLRIRNELVHLLPPGESRNFHRRFI